MPLGTQFHGKALRKADHCPFGGGVWCSQRISHPACNRRNTDDAAAPQCALSIGTGVARAEEEGRCRFTSIVRFQSSAARFSIEPNGTGDAGVVVPVCRGGRIRFRIPPEEVVGLLFVAERRTSRQATPDDAPEISSRTGLIGIAHRNGGPAEPKRLGNTPSDARGTARHQRVQSVKATTSSSSSP